MKKHKKVIFIALAAVLVIGATLGAVTMAQADDGDTQAPRATMYQKVAEVYQANTGTAIDPAALQEAFNQVRQEMTAQARENMKERVATSFEDRLQQMLDEGKITQEQIDAYKAWLEARPQLNTDEFKQWLAEKPEGLTFGEGQRDGSVYRNFSRMGKMFRNFCAPDAAEE